jgi:hypothetical protein
MDALQGDYTLYSDECTISGKRNKNYFDGKWTIKYNNGKVETGNFR